MKNESICTLLKRSNGTFECVVVFSAHGDSCEDIIRNMQPLLKDVINSETVTNIMSRGEPGDNDVRELRDAFKSEIDKSPLLKFDGCEYVSECGSLYRQKFNGYRYVSEHGSLYKRENYWSYRATVNFLRVIDVPQSNPRELVGELVINIYPVIGIEDLEESDEQENQ